MNEPVRNDAVERQWAKEHFRSYLLGQLNEDDTERLTMAVAIYSGLVDDLEDVESELIDAYLDRRLVADEYESFERQYVHTDVMDNRAKFQVQRALRSKEVERTIRAAAPVPMSSLRRPLALSLLAASAALILAGVLGGLYYTKSRALDQALAELKVKQVRPGPEIETPPEQPAGSSTPEGLILSAKISGVGSAVVTAPPEHLIWTPVPDYRDLYRFRIYSAGGQEITSPLLNPQNNTITYAVQNSSSLTLPWDVFVLNGATVAEHALAHYVIRRR